MSTEAADRLGASVDDVERVIAALQTLDPPGVFARNLAECLAIQLRQKDRFDPAMQALVCNLELLARRDFATLKRLCGVDEEDLLDMLGEIRQLNPKPGAGFEAGVSEAIMPDVVVRAGSSTAAGWSSLIPIRCRAFWSIKRIFPKSRRVATITPFCRNVCRPPTG